MGVGTGLGLAICHGIVTALGGSLDFDSEIGKGTSFRVELPIAGSAVPSKSKQTLATCAPSSRRPSSGRISVVDDEPNVCFSLERLLAVEAQVVAVPSARQALSMIAAGERFDIILCDLMLPEMDGPALHEEILKVDHTQAERMVFATGGAFTVRARNFLSSVENPRLEKPFDIDAMLALVRERLPRDTT